MVHFIPKGLASAAEKVVKTMTEPTPTKRATFLDIQTHKLKQALELLNIDPKPWSIGTWSPGDGWTRYRIYRKNEGIEVSHYMRKAELAEWINGFLKAASYAAYGVEHSV